MDKEFWEPSQFELTEFCANVRDLWQEVKCHDLLSRGIEPSGLSWACEVPVAVWVAPSCPLSPFPLGWAFSPLLHHRPSVWLPPPLLLFLPASPCFSLLLVSFSDFQFLCVTQSSFSQ